MPDGRVESNNTAIHLPSADPDPGARSSRREFFVGVFLAVIVFTFHYVVESKLRAMGAFTLFNTLFNADPGLTLEAISSGGGGNHLSHPLLEYFFSIPIGVVAKLGSLISSGGLDEASTRVSLAMFVVPVAAGLQTFVALRIMRTLGLSLRSSLLLVVLGALSFSRLLLGSMPESYCLSALCISLGYMLFLRTRDRRGLRVELSWIALGVLTAGVTVTNAVAVAILYFVRERGLGRGFWYGGVRTAGAVAVILAVTLAAGFALDELFDAQPGQTPDEMVWISRYFVDDPMVQLTTFPTAVVNGLAPPVPGRKPNRFALRAEKAAARLDKPEAARRAPRRPSMQMPGVPAEDDASTESPGFLNRGTEVDPDLTEATAGDAPAGSGSDVAAASSEAAPGPAQSERIIPFSLTLQRTHAPRSIRNYIGFILLAALAWVALKDKWLEPTFRSLARASLAIVAFNWILHGLWGGEQFLYSQHWHMSLLVLLGAAAFSLETRGRNAYLPLVICVVGIAVSNSIVLAKTLRALLEG